MKTGVISIIGMPGSGKTTLGKMMAEKFKFHHLIAGDVARQYAAEDKYCAAELAAGRVAPPANMNKLMRTSIQQRLGLTPLIVDGYPRYYDQYLDLIELAGDDDIYFIVLACDESVAAARILGRGRSDDNRAALESRLKFYWQETLPVSNMLRSAHLRNTICVPADTPEGHLNYVNNFLKQLDLV